MWIAFLALWTMYFLFYFFSFLKWDGHFSLVPPIVNPFLCNWTLLLSPQRLRWLLQVIHWSQEGAWQWFPNGWEICFQGYWCARWRWMQARRPERRWSVDPMDSDWKVRCQRRNEPNEAHFSSRRLLKKYFVFWTLWERERVGWFGRMALKYV